jgi:predicted metalloprotease with PDZ domain
MSPPLRYRVRPHDPAAHLFEVELTVEDPAARGEILRLPAWIPGSYTIRDFARHVVRIEARGPSGALSVDRVDKDTWRVATTEGPLTVRIEVYAWDLSVRTAHLDTTHGFFNGTSLFLVPEGKADRPCEVELVPPPGDLGWRVATTLPRLSGEPWGFGTFRAEDHDALIDHPVELGTWTHVAFTACGVPHDVVITGRVRFDADRLARDLGRVCEQHVRLFGEPAPFDRYLFLTTAVGDGYGGLEHRDSTALLCKRSDLPAPGQPEISEGYRTFLGLCSHEYFHSWNVKRVKPRRFVPYDLWREAHTTQLWAFEGLTSWYDDLALLRAGLLDEPSWLELVGRTITSVLRTPGRHVQSLAEASFDAWTKYYKQDENTPNAQVSYYTKGSLVGLALDLHLRRLTRERVGLDDVMRTLWSRHGDGSGVPEGGVEAVAAELAGEDLGPFFDAAIRGTDDLPITPLLAWVGLDLRLRPAAGDDDRGGRAGPDKPTADLGVTVARGGDAARLTHVLDGGAARAAGLSAGDVVIALDGLRVGGADLTPRVRALPPGTAVTLHAFRRDELHEFRVTLAEAPRTTAWIESRPAADAVTLARRERWLRGETLA